LKSIKCTRYSRHFGLLTLNIVWVGGGVDVGCVLTKKVVAVPYLSARVVVYRYPTTNVKDQNN